MRTTRRPEISCHRNVRNMQYASLSPSLSLTQKRLCCRERVHSTQNILMLKSWLWCVNGEKLFSASQRCCWEEEKNYDESRKGLERKSSIWKKEKEGKHIFLPRAIRSLSFFYFSVLFRLFPYDMNLCFLLCAMLITIWFVWIEIIETVRTFGNCP